MGTMASYEGFSLRINSWQDGVDYAYSQSNWSQLIRNSNNYGKLTDIQVNGNTLTAVFETKEYVTIASSELSIDKALKKPKASYFKRLSYTQKPRVNEPAQESRNSEKYSVSSSYPSPSNNIFKTREATNVDNSSIIDEKNKQLERKMAEFERSQQEALKREEALREEEQRQLEYERDQQRREFEEQQEELQNQREQLERQEEKRQESMRLDYCGHCHNPVTFDYEEILIDNYKYRIHKSCMDAFKTSGSEMYNKWQETNERLEKERLKKQKEYDEKKAAVEKWLIEDEDGKVALKEFVDSHKADIEESVKIECLYSEMVSLKRKWEITIRDNELWIKNTDEGKTFDTECSEKDPKKRQKLIKTARVDYECKQYELKRKEQKRLEEERLAKEKREREIALEIKKATEIRIPIVSKLQNILDETSLYFETSKKEQVETLLNECLKKINSIETVEGLKAFEPIQNLDLEKVPSKKKVWKRVIRIYVDIVMTVIFGGIGFAYIYMEPNLKFAIIFLTLAALFMISPVIGKIVTQKQTSSITSKNVAKLKDILEK